MSSNMSTSATSNTPTPSTPGLSNAIAAASIANSNTTVTNTPVLEYYLIAYGTVKPRTDESAMASQFTSKHDLDAKFIYLEPG